MAFSKLSTALLAAAAVLSSFANGLPVAPVTNFKRSDTLKWDFNTEKIRGVNLGGWLVLEPFITPSLFEATPADVVDEWTMSAHYGKTEMEKHMHEHWSTWIVEDDFATMASYGLNMVRIPIGYWSVCPIPDEPYVQGAYEWLETALGWAAKHGIKVMIDLHGAPGSQNGFDNSGHRGAIEWLQGDTIAQTHETLNKIREDHASNPVVVAIELLNEPYGQELDMTTVTQFYNTGWENLQDAHVAIAFHDCFEGVTSWNDWGAGMWNLLEDTHFYQIFSSPLLALSLPAQIEAACQYGSQMASNNKWTVCGEFSGALTDCAKWVNGRGIGARYDGTYNYEGIGSSYIGSCDGLSTGTVDGLSETQKDNIAQFIQAQMVAFEYAEGWMFWSWKCESAPEWHYKNLTLAGIIPKSVKSGLDTSICG